MERAGGQEARRHEMRLGVASDHAGFRYKQAVAEYLRGLGHEVRDFGAASEEPVDYPDLIRPLALAVAAGDPERGIVFGGSGNGEAMAANRVPGVRVRGELGRGVRAALSRAQRLERPLDRPEARARAQPAAHRRRVAEDALRGRAARRERSASSTTPDRSRAPEARYSARITSRGSTRVAHQAGRRQPATAGDGRSRAAAAKVTGSTGLTPASSASRLRPAAQAKRQAQARARWPRAAGRGPRPGAGRRASRRPARGARRSRASGSRPRRRAGRGCRCPRAAARARRRPRARRTWTRRGAVCVSTIVLERAHVRHGLLRVDPGDDPAQGGHERAGIAGVLHREVLRRVEAHRVLRLLPVGQVDLRLAAPLEAAHLARRRRRPTTVRLAATAQTSKRRARSGPGRASSARRTTRSRRPPAGAAAVSVSLDVAPPPDRDARASRSSPGSRSAGSPFCPSSGRAACPSASISRSRRASTIGRKLVYAALDTPGSARTSPRTRRVEAGARGDRLVLRHRQRRAQRQDARRSGSRDRPTGPATAPGSAGRTRPAGRPRPCTSATTSSERSRSRRPPARARAFAQAGGAAVAAGCAAPGTTPKPRPVTSGHERRRTRARAGRAAGASRDRQRVRHQPRQRAAAAATREQHAQDAAQQREQEALGQELAHEPLAAGAQRRRARRARARRTSARASSRLARFVHAISSTHDARRRAGPGAAAAPAGAPRRAARTTFAPTSSFSFGYCRSSRAATSLISARACSSDTPGRSRADARRGRCRRGRSKSALASRIGRQSCVSRLGKAEARAA